MLVVFRWWYFLGLGGIGLGAYGGVETSLALRCAAEPTQVAVGELVDGNAPAQPYVRLGRHLVVEPFTCWSETRNRITHVAYPILDVASPFVASWQEMLRKYGALADVPPRQVPSLETANIVVVRRDSAVPRQAELREAASVEGMLFPYASYSQKSEERRLADEVLPRVPKSRVFVLEEGRRPTSLFASVLMLVGAVVMLYGAVVLFRRPRPVS